MKYTTSLTAAAVIAVTLSSASAAVTIQNYTKVLDATATDGPTDNDNDTVATYPFVSSSVSASQGTSSALADFNFTDTTGVPATLGATVSGFVIEFTSEVTASSNAVDATANASSGLAFQFVVTGTVEVNFSNTGSDADFRFFVDGNIATNANQTLVLSDGTYNVSFSDGAGANSGDSGAASNQTNDQTYRLSVQTIPEPSSTALLGLAGLGLILRRRK